MTVVEILGIVAMLITNFVLTARAERVFDRRLAEHDRRLAEHDAADEGRRQAIYQQQKESQKVIAQQQRALEILANQSRALHDEARLTHQRVDQHFAHPNVKRIING